LVHLKDASFSILRNRVASFRYTHNRFWTKSILDAARVAGVALLKGDLRGAGLSVQSPSFPCVRGGGVELHFSLISCGILSFVRVSVEVKRLCKPAPPLSILDILTVLKRLLWRA
jgi:hypothetical protein